MVFHLGGRRDGNACSTPFATMKTMTPALHGIEIPRAQIARFCGQHLVRKLALFGSILTDRFRADSDVDVLVEFEREHVPGLFGMVEMESELAGMLGRKVDLRTAGDLSRYFRDEVVASALVQYEPS
jgi:predicted nucleotidyltransferase